MTRPNWLLRFLDWGYRNPIMLTLVILTCLGVGGWGFYDYYGAQFEWIGTEHWYVWPFVADCPLFVYLFVAAVLLRAAGVAAPGFTAFVAVGNIKYGLWTVFVLLYYFDRFFGPGGDTVLRGAILLLHVGMVPLGVILWRTLPPLKRPVYVAVLGWSLVFDYFDYFYTRTYQIYPIGLPYGRVVDGTPTPLPWQELGLVPWVTIGASVLLSAGLWFTFWLRDNKPMPQADVRPLVFTRPRREETATSTSER